MVQDAGKQGESENKEKGLIQDKRQLLVMMRFFDF